MSLGAHEQLKKAVVSPRSASAPRARHRRARRSPLAQPQLRANVRGTQACRSGVPARHTRPRSFDLGVDGRGPDLPTRFETRPAPHPCSKRTVPRLKVAASRTPAELSALPQDAGLRLVWVCPP